MNRSKGLMFLMLMFVGASAFILNYAGLYALAISGGYPSGVAWLLPFCVDAGAIAALLAWRTGFAPAKPAMQAACGLMIGGVALQVMQHLVAAGNLPNGWWLTAVVGAIPAVVLALIVHAFAQNGTPRQTEGQSNIVWRRVVEPVGELATPVVEPVDQGGDAGDQVVDLDDDQVRQVAAIIAKGGGRKTVKTELGLDTDYKARKLMEAAKDYASTGASLNGSAPR